MLAEADPRGFQGVLVARIEFQRAGEGHPLDDVITGSQSLDLACERARHVLEPERFMG